MRYTISSLIRGTTQLRLLLLFTVLQLVGAALPAWAARIIKITPASGPCGTVITVTGTGFTNGNTVNVNYGGCDTTSEVKITGGAFTATVKADCDKAGTNGVVSEEYNSQGSFIAKSNRLDFKQTTGCTSKEFLTTALSVESSDNRVHYITHTNVGVILSKGEDSTCVAGTSGAVAPAECGVIRKLNWNVASILDDHGMVKSIVSYAAPDLNNPKYDLFCLHMEGNRIESSGRVKSGKALEDRPHFFAFGHEGGLHPQSTLANPDVYYVTRSGTNSLMQEAVYNLQTSSVVAPFRTLLTVPSSTAVAAYSSPSGDISGFLRRGVGLVESFHKVGSQTGTVPILQRSNIFGMTIDSTSAIPEITSTDGTYRRVMVYSAIVQNGAAFTRGIFTQVFSSKGATLTPRGPAKVIQPFQNTAFPGAEQIFNNVSIAEDGSFAVYASFNTSCNKDTLWFQKLNPLTGSKIGPRKPLLDCSALTGTSLGAHAVDVLRLR